MDEKSDSSDIDSKTLAQLVSGQRNKKRKGKKEFVSNKKRKHNKKSSKQKLSDDETLQPSKKRKSQSLPGSFYSEVLKNCMENPELYELEPTLLSPNSEESISTNEHLHSASLQENVCQFKDPPNTGVSTSDASTNSDPSNIQKSEESISNPKHLLSVNLPEFQFKDPSNTEVSTSDASTNSDPSNLQKSVESISNLKHLLSVNLPEIQFKDPPNADVSTSDASTNSDPSNLQKSEKSISNDKPLLPEKLPEVLNRFEDPNTTDPSASDASTDHDLSNIQKSAQIIQKKYLSQDFEVNADVSENFCLKPSKVISNFQQNEISLDDNLELRRKCCLDNSLLSATIKDKAQKSPSCTFIPNNSIDVLSRKDMKNLDQVEVSLNDCTSQLETLSIELMFEEKELQKPVDQDSQMSKWEKLLDKILSTSEAQQNELKTSKEDITSQLEILSNEQMLEEKKLQNLVHQDSQKSKLIDLLDEILSYTEVIHNKLKTPKNYEVFPLVSAVFNDNAVDLQSLIPLIKKIEKHIYGEKREFGVLYENEMNSIVYPVSSNISEVNTEPMSENCLRNCETKPPENDPLPPATNFFISVDRASFPKKLKESVEASDENVVEV